MRVDAPQRFAERRFAELARVQTRADADLAAIVIRRWHARAQRQPRGCVCVERSEIDGVAVDRAERDVALEDPHVVEGGIDAEMQHRIVRRALPSLATSRSASSSPPGCDRRAASRGVTRCAAAGNARLRTHDRRCIRNAAATRFRAPVPTTERAATGSAMASASGEATIASRAARRVARHRSRRVRNRSGSLRRSRTGRPSIVDAPRTGTQRVGELDVAVTFSAAAVPALHAVERERDALAGAHVVRRFGAQRRASSPESRATNARSAMPARVQTPASLATRPMRARRRSACRRQAACRCGCDRSASRLRAAGSVRITTGA